MTVSAVAFVPSAPLLIPAVAGGSASLDEELRAASVEVVARAVSVVPDEVVVVASTTSVGEWTEAATWSFSGFGVARTPPDGRPAVPWSLGIGSWLLDECGWSGRRRYIGLGAHADGSVHPPIAPGSVVVAVGDGSARRSERAPGHLDGRAEPFDDRVADFLARGDIRAIAAVDEILADELWCGGLRVWRWVAALVGDQAVTKAELVANTAPYGVGYFVALWSLG